MWIYIPLTIAVLPSREGRVLSWIWMDVIFFLAFCVEEKKGFVNLRLRIIQIKFRITWFTIMISNKPMSDV